MEKLSSSRLPSILLARYNSEKIGSVNHTLSKYLLENIDTIQELNIKELADACFMSPSTVSRFCKSIGLNDFNTLKQEFHNILFYRDEKFNINFDDEPDYLLKISQEIADLHHDLDFQAIHDLVKDIYDYQNVAVFGSMQALNPAVYLQQELYVSRKIVCCKENFNYQLDYFKQANEKDLIIIFSSMGGYFDIIFERRHQINLLKKPKIWVITYNKEIASYEGVDRILYIENKDINYINHPLKFNIIANMIAAQYAKLCKDLEK